MPLRRRPLFAVAVCLTLGASVEGLSGQTITEMTSSPDETAGLFLRSVRSIRWSTTAPLLHPETLDRFRTTVTLIADADVTGEVRRYLLTSDSVRALGLDDAEVFQRAIGVMIDDMPGLMHALFDRDDEVIGHVPENSEGAHVVYRTTARISGAVPEVKVMQLGRTEEGWRVLWSDELEVLEAALRGVAR